MSSFGIKKELEKVINKMGIAEEFEAFRVCKSSQKVIADFCEKEREKPKVVKYIKQTQTLEIKLGNIILGQKIRAKSDSIINKINREVGRKCVEKIRYQVI